VAASDEKGRGADSVESGHKQHMAGAYCSVGDGITIPPREPNHGTLGSVSDLTGKGLRNAHRLLLLLLFIIIQVISDDLVRDLFGISNFSSRTPR
jgi:hypothetical protein